MLEYFILEDAENLLSLNPFMDAKLAAGERRGKVY
jgi:hypothetical protein